MTGISDDFHVDSPSALSIADTRTTTLPRGFCKVSPQVVLPVSSAVTSWTPDYWPVASAPGRLHGSSTRTSSLGPFNPCFTRHSATTPIPHHETRRDHRPAQPHRKPPKRYLPAVRASQLSKSQPKAHPRNQSQTSTKSSTTST